jgi:magnesium chelatase subunit I
MDLTKIKTLGELKKSGYISKSIKQEIRENLITKIKAKENPFPGILGYEDSGIQKELYYRNTIFYFWVYVARPKPVWQGR